MVLSVVEFAAMPDIAEYSTIEEAASHPDVPYTAYWVRRLAQEGKIEAIKVGPAERGQWLVYMPSLLEYIHKMDDLGTAKHARKD
jgi:hypothetical protein